MGLCPVDSDPDGLLLSLLLLLARLTDSDLENEIGFRVRVVNPDGKLTECRDGRI